MPHWLPPQLTLTISADGTAIYDGEYPGRWSRQSDRITVKVFADDSFMRRNESALTLKLDIAGTGMTGTQLPHRGGNVSVSALGLTLTRLN